MAAQEQGSARSQPVAGGSQQPAYAPTPTPSASVCIHCNALRDEVAALRKALGLAGRSSDLLALGRAYGLHPAERRLLMALYDAAGKIVPQYTLAQIVVKDSALLDGSDALKVHISNVRSKLGGEIIETVRGEGYAITDAGRALVTAALTVHREAA